MASELASGNYSITCRCGAYATVLSETDTIRRVDCWRCGTQTLWGDELE